MSFLTLSALFLTGCAKTENINSADEKGAPTYMGVSLSFPKATETRATSDVNATVDEVKFATVDVFIFNTATGVQVANQTFTGSDFQQGTSTSGSDVWNGKQKIATTTGAKTVLAGLNLPTALVGKLKGMNLGEFLNQVQTIDMADLKNANGMVMFSRERKDCIFVNSASDPANNPTITVMRMVAKVTVEEQSGGAVKNGLGTLSDLQYTIFNSNTKMYLCPTSDYKDPNWAAASYAAADFQDLTAGYVNVNSFDVPIASRVAVYAAENSSEQHRGKEITRAVVRAKFLPSIVVEYMNGMDATGGFKENNAHGVAAPRTFWTVTETNGLRAYFFNKNVAEGYHTSKTGSAIEEYTDGYCYYNLFLNPRGMYRSAADPARVFDVYRNDYYRCTITKILAPGRSTPDVPYPDGPPATATDIHVDIEILFWNLVSDNYELEP
ncbi:MAG: Mfa1 family fimbria major subunit [Tannerella sp.]|nr:Mfa1 family fimbria major subunit [Tannerella sp.]